MLELDITTELPLPSALKGSKKKPNHESRKRGRVSFASMVTVIDSASIAALKSEAQPPGYLTAFWNDVKGTSEPHITVTLDMLKKLGLFQLDMKALSKDFDLYIELARVTSSKALYAKNLQHLFARYVELKSANMRLGFSPDFHATTPLARGIWRKVLSHGKWNEAFEILHMVTELGRGILSQVEPRFLVHVRGLSQSEQTDVFRYIEENKEQFSSKKWESYLSFFQEPISEYLREREVFREEYFTFLNTGLVQSILANQIKITKSLIALKVPEFLTNLLTVQTHRAKSLVDLCVFEDPILQENPVVRADKYFSNYKRNNSCPSNCDGHQGKLFLLVIRLGLHEMASLLLSNGMPVNSISCSGQIKRLFWIRGDTFPVEIQRQVPNFSKNDEFLKAEYEYVTPLARATECGDAEMVQLLLSYRANPLQAEDIAVRTCINLVTYPKVRDGEEESIIKSDYKVCTKVILKEAKKRLAIDDSKEAAHYCTIALIYQAAKDGNWRAIKKLTPRKAFNTALKITRRGTIDSRTNASVLSFGSTLSLTNRKTLVSRLEKKKSTDKKGIQVDDVFTTIYVKVIDKLMADGFELDIASHAHIIKGVVGLLEFKELILNSKRYEQLLEIGQKALRENKAGDEEALMVLLASTEIQRVLGLLEITSESIYRDNIKELIRTRQLNTSSRAVRKSMSQYLKSQSCSKKKEADIFGMMKSAQDHKDEFALDSKLSVRNIFLLVARNGMARLLHRLHAMHVTRKVDDALAQTVLNMAIVEDQYLMIEPIISIFSFKLLRHGFGYALSGSHLESLETVMRLLTDKENREYLHVDEMLSQFLTCPEIDDYAIDIMLKYLMTPEGYVKEYVSESDSKDAIAFSLREDVDINPYAVRAFLVEIVMENFPDILNLDTLVAAIRKIRSLLADVEDYELTIACSRMLHVLFTAQQDEIPEEVKNECYSLFKIDPELQIQSIYLKDGDAEMSPEL